MNINGIDKASNVGITSGIKNGHGNRQENENEIHEWRQPHSLQPAASASSASSILSTSSTSSMPLDSTDSSGDSCNQDHEDEDDDEDEDEDQDEDDDEDNEQEEAEEEDQFNYDHAFREFAAATKGITMDGITMDHPMGIGMGLQRQKQKLVYLDAQRSKQRALIRAQQMQHNSNGNQHQSQLNVDGDNHNVNCISASSGSRRVGSQFQADIPPIQPRKNVATFSAANRGGTSVNQASNTNSIGNAISAFELKVLQAKPVSIAELESELTETSLAEAEADESYANMNFKLKEDKGAAEEKSIASVCSAVSTNDEDNTEIDASMSDVGSAARKASMRDANASVDPTSKRKSKR
jgi:hypothetical protein